MSLGLNQCAIHAFRIVWYDLKARLSLYDVLGLVGIFGWGPGGLGCDSDYYQIIFGLRGVADGGLFLVSSHRRWDWPQVRNHISELWFADLEMALPSIGRRSGTFFAEVHSLLRWREHRSALGRRCDPCTAEAKVRDLSVSRICDDFPQVRHRRSDSWVADAVWLGRKRGKTRVWSHFYFGT